MAMSSRRTLLLRAFVPLLLSAACGKLLGIDPLPDGESGGASPKSGESRGGGSLAMAGAPALEAGGAAGRLGDLPAGQAGTSAGGSNRPGTGILDTGGEGGGGEGGGSDASPWPEDGQRCSVPGRVECSGARSHRRFLCQDGRWVETDDCPAAAHEQLCDRKTGACAPTLCTVPGPTYCPGLSQSMVCGPDTVTQDIVYCPFGCVTETGACALPGPRELVIDGLEVAPTRGGRPPLVPVCWQEHAAEPTMAAVRDAIRLAADTTWSRYSGASFTGWQACGDEPDQGVRIELVDDCMGRLASASDLSPDAAQRVLSVELCTSYLDDNGTRHPAPGGEIDLGLVGFAAKHVFGHVLGFGDRHYTRPGFEVMDAALDLDHYPAIAFQLDEITQVQASYGLKPPRTLLAPNGRCLGLASDQLAPLACDGSDAQQWQMGASNVTNVAGGVCLSEAGGSVNAGKCSEDAAAQAFRSDRMRWLAAGGRCVGVVTSPNAGDSPLAVGQCDAAWPAAQAFAFEFVGDRSIRIKAGSNTCVKWPAPGQVRLPLLGACDGSHDTFDTQGGHLGDAGYCLEADNVSIKIEACGDFTAQRFYMSGAFELSPNALTLSLTQPPAGLAMVPLSWPPRPEQVFDYYF
jgi:hypothetical protein